MPSFELSGQIVAKRRPPVAAMVPSQEFAVLGSVISLDARQSYDPDGNPLSYKFSFISTPIGSRAALEDFRQLDGTGEVVSFSPDIVGQYVVGLRVSNGVFDSEMVTKTIDVRAILVPHARGLVPDGKFIWSYLRDVWTQVDGKEFFETLWSALIQICGSELLKLYQVDYNKSIRDIQDLYQRRWLCYEPRLDLLSLAADDLTTMLGQHAAGHSAATGSMGEAGLAIITTSNELVVVQGAVRTDMAGRSIDILYSRNPENAGAYVIAGMTSKQNGFRIDSDFPFNPETVNPGSTSDVILRDVSFQFEFQSTTWHTGVTRERDFFMSEYVGIDIFHDIDTLGLGQVRVGDVIVVPSGVNAGYYRVVQKVGANLIVDHKPPAASVPTDLSTVYRPVGFVIPPLEADLSDTISIPLSDARSLESTAAGRVVVVNGETHTIARVAVDANQRTPMLVIATAEKRVLPGLRGLAWRIPHTLISKSLDFEKLGVRAGDTLLVSVNADNGNSVEIPLQVVGVTGNRLGFVLFTDDAQIGEVSDVPANIFLTLSKKLGIDSVTLLPDGSVAFAGQAKEVVSYASSIFFRRSYWDVELPISTVFQSGGRSFTVTPKAIIRNRLVPVDPLARSIPALQEFISQPVILVEDGKYYQVRGDKKFERRRLPVVAQERTHYVVDGASAFNGTLTFRTGTDLIDADGGDFVDLGVEPGDIFHIEAPISLYGDYPIAEVISRRQLKLSKPVPRFPISDYVTGTVELQRHTSGHFIRFIPGLFTAKNPAPDRLWAEVSFFDNSDNIEQNFGVLVGLTKKDLEEATASASYRQAVAGLMYAYVSGSVIDKVRLGASLLLGLPFTEVRGVIRSIEPDYRLDAAGTPVLGRILIEDVDATGQPQGVFRVYTYPIDLVSELAGIDTNPVTGQPYAVGDVVEAFSSLSKGVEIADFKIPFTGSRTAEQQLQQYHSARVRINDNIFQPKEVALVSAFLRKITPSYVALTITNTSEFADRIQIIDKIAMRMKGGARSAPVIVDSVGVPYPDALLYDGKTHRGLPSYFWDEGPLLIRRAGRDLTVSTVPTQATTSSGGLLNQRANESFESPICRTTDLLLIQGGVNDGVYHITSIPDDGTMNVQESLAPDTNMHYAVVRKVKGILRSGTIGTVSSDRFSFTVEGGLRNDYVCPGAHLVSSDGTTSYRHTVVKVEKTGNSWNSLTVTPALPNGVTSYSIFQDDFLVPEDVTATVTADGTGKVTAPSTLQGFLDVDDTLRLFAESTELRVTVLAPKTPDGKLFVSPPLPTGSHQVSLIKDSDHDTPVSFEQPVLDDVANISWFYRDPADRTDADPEKPGTTPTGADATVAGTTITFGNLSPQRSGTKPGDLLILQSGNFPIISVTKDNVVVSDPPGNGTSPWKIRRTLRKRTVVEEVFGSGTGSVLAQRRKYAFRLKATVSELTTVGTRDNFIDGSIWTSRGIRDPLPYTFCKGGALNQRWPASNDASSFSVQSYLDVGQGLYIGYPIPFSSVIFQVTAIPVIPSDMTLPNGRLDDLMTHLPISNYWSRVYTGGDPESFETVTSRIDHGQHDPTGNDVSVSYKSASGTRTSPQVLLSSFFWKNIVGDVESYGGAFDVRHDCWAGLSWVGDPRYGQFSLTFTAPSDWVPGFFSDVTPQQVAADDELLYWVRLQLPRPSDTLYYLSRSAGRYFYICGAPPAFVVSNVE